MLKRAGSSIHDIREAEIIKQNHTRTVQNFFARMKEELVYFRIINFPERGENGNDDIIRVDILSKHMLDYDAFAFEKMRQNRQRNQSRRSYEMILDDEPLIRYEEGDRLPDGMQPSDFPLLYRPYFVAFYINPEEVPGKTLSFLRELARAGTWFYGSFGGADGHGVISNRRNKEVAGILLTSASPPEYKNWKFVFSDKRLSKEDLRRIEHDYETTDAVEEYDKIKKVLGERLQEAKEFQISIYNVGDGNCIYVQELDGKKSFYFDIGYEVMRTVKECEKYEYACGKLEGNIADMVVLSHWDLDHVLGISLAHDAVLDCPWIAPDLNNTKLKPKTSARRLAKYLSILGGLHLVMIEEDEGKEIFKNNAVSVWRSAGERGGCKLTYNNRWGLVIEIVYGEIRTLLPGDVEYNALPVKLQFEENGYTYLLVPHHASGMETSGIKDATATWPENKAIVCASGKNEKRPHKEHLQSLVEKGYDYKLTGDHKAIEIENTSEAGQCKCI